MNRYTAHLAFRAASEILRLGNRRRVIYHEHWQPVRDALDGGYIFAVNHPTSADPIYCYDLIYRPVILAIEFVFNLPIVGPIFKGLNCIPVPIDEQDPRRHQAYCAALNALYCGRNLLVAPEGKISPLVDHKPKTGIARLSTQSSRPIVPMGICHLGRGYTFHLKAKGHRQRIRFIPFGWTTVRFGAPIYANGNEPHEVVTRVMTEIRRLSSI